MNGLESQQVGFELCFESLVDPRRNQSFPCDAGGHVDMDRLEQHMLREWGYPYVFDTFTFHITLTGMLAPAEQEAALASLRADTGALLATPLAVDAISVFVQPEPGAGFVAARHYGFDGRTRDGAGRAYLP